jgi:pilus assembly protein CpaB
MIAAQVRPLFGEGGTMKPKTMLLAVVAVVCGLGAMWMTNRLLADKQKEAPAQEAKEKVLVAKAKIPSQTVFKDPDKFFEEKEMPVSAIPKLALRSTDKVKDKRLSRTLANEAYVFAEDLVNPETDGLGAVLPAGMRAVAIRVQPDSLVGGHVLPGSHVDVLCTVRSNDGSTTYTILENMEVLAIDLKHNRSPDDAPAMLGNTVTLAASPEDCNLLKMAAGNGELNLILRGIGDLKETKPKSINQKALQTPRQSQEGLTEVEIGIPSTGGARIPDLPPLEPGAPPIVAPPIVGAPIVAPPIDGPPIVTLPGTEPVQKEPAPEVFIMTITTGTNTEKVRFVRKPGDPWTTQRSEPTNPAAPPDKKPESQPTAPPLPGARTGNNS